jgi:hypothetical protein
MLIATLQLLVKDTKNNFNEKNYFKSLDKYLLNEI